MIRRPPRSTLDRSSAASDVYKRQGLFIELPEGFEAQIRPRSGLAARSGITILNSPGTIDADYRGEILSLIHISEPTRPY